MSEGGFLARLEAALNGAGRWTRVHRTNCGQWLATSHARARNGKPLRFEEFRPMTGAPAGVADLVGYVRRLAAPPVYLEVETKAARGAQRESQRRRQVALERDGAIYILIREQPIETAIAAIDAAILKALERWGSA